MMSHEDKLAKEDTSLFIMDTKGMMVLKFRVVVTTYKREFKIKAMKENLSQKYS